jgi:undecaprenyl diphosphate synthase
MPRLFLMSAPRHLGLIMDGNRRWAQAHGLPAFVGHRRGARRLHPILEACYSHGVQVVSVYALSTENRHSRSRTEVKLLLDLLASEGQRLVDHLDRAGVRFVHSGERQDLPATAGDFLQQAADQTRDNGPQVFNLAFNYGGRAELVRACRRLLAEGIAPEAIDESHITAQLYTAGLPDMDLVLRTGGDNRLSNFFPWQCNQARLYITDTYWPALSVSELAMALHTPQETQNAG